MDEPLIHDNITPIISVVSTRFQGIMEALSMQRCWFCYFWASVNFLFWWVAGNASTTTNQCQPHLHSSIETTPIYMVFKGEELLLLIKQSCGVAYPVLKLFSVTKTAKAQPLHHISTIFLPQFCITTASLSPTNFHIPHTKEAPVWIGQQIMRRDMLRESRRTAFPGDLTICQQTTNEKTS